MAVAKKVSLKKLAQGINRTHKAASAHLEEYREQAKQCGKMLIKAKESVPAGEWTEWLKDNCSDLSVGTARHYMKFARGEVDSLHRGTTPGVVSSNGNGDPDVIVKQLSDRPRVERQRVADALYRSIDDDLPEDEEEFVEEAVALSKEGKTYKEVAEELRTKPHVLQSIEEVREEQERQHPDEQSAAVSPYYCASSRPSQPEPLIREIESNVNALLGDGYKLGKSDRKRLMKVSEKIQERFNSGW